MTVELNRATFGRLVKLYLLSILVIVACSVYVMLMWAEFGVAFDALNIEYFGEPDETAFWVTSLVVIGAAVAHLAGLFGLLRYKSWARGLTWISLLVMIPTTFVPGFGFLTSHPAEMWLELANSVLLGMILLLAYSKDHGALWFTTLKPEASSHEPL